MQDLRQTTAAGEMPWRAGDAGTPPPHLAGLRGLEAGQSE